MGESNENLLKAIRHCQQSLDKYTEHRNDSKLLHYLERLHKLPIKVAHLEETGVGRTVNGLRKLGGSVGDSAKGLVAKWKDMVVDEQEEEEEDDDEEDGYQTGEDESDSAEDTSSHRKSDNHRTDDKGRKSKHGSKSERHSSERSSKKDERHKRKHSEHKSHKHDSDSSSEDETPKKRQKKSDEDRHRSRSDDERRHKSKKSADSDSDHESKSKEKKYKSDKHKSEKKRSSDNERSSKSKEKSRESSSKDKDKHKSSRKDDSKRHESSSKTKEEKKRKDKVRSKSEDKKEKSSKPKVLNGGLLHEGIGSGSGASFAEALGMCEPSSSKSSAKKKVEKKEKPPTKVDDAVPKLLKEPAVEPPLDINLSSLLPPITPNYRPLGNLISSDSQSKKFMSESEALVNIITSKNQRTKVYSGNKTGNGVVPSLFELCIRLLQDHIDALEYTGGVPYNVLKPILEKANPNQLYMMEHHNPYLIEDTDELWALHCQREFRNKERQEMETWRDMYLRCLDERDARLKALTANIKQAQDKSLPVRMTKLAYVDAVAKPPRNIARRQAKNGTAFDIRKPAMTPSARLSSLATAGEAGKVAVPNPGSRAAERSSSHAAKPKKAAPLMLKSISSFKNRFKR